MGAHPMSRGIAYCVACGNVYRGRPALHVCPMAEVRTWTPPQLDSTDEVPTYTLTSLFYSFSRPAGVSLSERLHWEWLRTRWAGRVDR
jgi:hypothetical protein